MGVRVHIAVSVPTVTTSPCTPTTAFDGVITALTDPYQIDSKIPPPVVSLVGTDMNMGFLWHVHVFPPLHPVCDGEVGLRV